MVRYVVLTPNGNGFHEVARVEAATANHAIEQAAQEPGDYLAIPESKLRSVTVAPITSLRVVPPVAVEE
jgi:hypothetical protein